ncbi:short chain dehydrogenase, putative [Bodo saltans]|uniref:Short chain dehydrogenase, putative n=1 Tax=Bodo saltans TaxID=75058 RepID=A0A0S4JL82_BODSA|nr:short chain dehydrogenase, putative [Bodo saltans]|eukprot:CUG89819.1 short chain dehydrogenase, putative [Bodo saltans]
MDCNCSHVILVGRTEATLLETKALLQKESSSLSSTSAASATATTVSIQRCDITSSADVQLLALHVRDVLDAVGERVGDENLRLTHVVLNAGSGAILRFVDSSWPEYEAVARSMMELNYFANVRLLHTFLPLMTSKPSSNGSNISSNNGSRKTTAAARVLIVSSLAGVLPSTLRSSYTASKHAMQGFINALRGEYRSDVVTFTNACPGYVDTAFHAKAASASSATPSSNNKNSTASSHRASSMSASECARICVAACLNGEPEIIMTLSGKLGYWLRPLIPRVVDRLAAKKSFASVGLKGP